MTEPNVLGNVSPAKFIWETGNTEIINLWASDEYGGNRSMHRSSAATLNGVAYLVPANRVFYLMKISCSNAVGGADVAIQKNTTIDTATGGTTLWRIFAIGANADYDVGYCKFEANEYVNQVSAVTDFFIYGWGVECDA